MPIQSHNCRLPSLLPSPPLDVRRAPTFQQAGELLTGAVWRDPECIDEWSEELDQARRVVVYCVRGHHVSHGCSQKLTDLGLNAAFLEGGIEAWISTGGKTTAKTGAST